jgi:signal transduction histidine kinase/FixJ family two-component response regulator
MMSLPGSTAPLALLVVDDDDVDRLAVRRYLRQSGLSVTIDEATSAAEALERIAARRYDCLLLDYYLPGVDGPALLQEIRAASPVMPVLIMTGRGDEDVAVELMKAGAVDYLMKASLSPERLTTALRHALELSRAAVRTACLQDLTAALAVALTPEDVASIVTRHAVNATGAVAGAVLLLEEATGVFEPVASVSADGAMDESETHARLAIDPRVSDVLRRGTARFDDAPGGPDAHLDADPSPAGSPRANEPGRAQVILPFFRAGETIGGLWLTYCGPRHFDAPDRHFLGTLAQQGAQALERARLYAAEHAARAEAEAAIRARDDLMGIISHDLRNPLTVVRGHIQLLRRRAARAGGLSTEELLSRLESIESSVISLGVQIDEIQDATHVQGGRPLALDLRPTDLVEVARSVVLRHRDISDRHQIRFESAVPSLVGTWDSRRLDRVLGNLLSNAIKYSPLGGEIAVALARDGDWAELTVEDHGLGIPAADLPHVFERFRRAGNVVGRISGSGLGLAGAREIVQQHGGTIRVASVEGQGSTFVVRLPMLPPEHDPESIGRA